MLTIPLIRPIRSNITVQNNIPVEKHYSSSGNLLYGSVNFTSHLASNTPIFEETYLANKIKQENKDKKAIIFTDFDGTLYPFYSKNTPDELIQTKEFKNILKLSKKSSQPIYLLTARNIGRFILNDQDKAFNNEQLNILGLRGNEILATLPEGNNTIEYINTLKSNPLYTTITQKTKQGIRVLSTALLDNNFIEATEDLKKEFKSTGINVEEKTSQVMIRWRQIRENVKTINKLGDTYVMNNVSEKFYNGLHNHKKYLSGKEIAILNPKDKTQKIECSFMEFLGYVQSRFEGVYSKFLNSPINDKNHAEINTRENFSELNLVNYMTKNKGESLEEIMYLYNNEFFPIFLGDNIGKYKDDESAIKSANIKKGYGIGIIGRFDKEAEMLANGQRNLDINKRLSSITDAKYLLKSYQKVQPFIENILTI